MLHHHLRQLLDSFATACSVEHVVVAEIGPDDWSAQRKPKIASRSLVDPPSYSLRFEQLIKAGYAWINLSYYGR